MYMKPGEALKKPVRKYQKRENANAYASQE